MTPLFGRLAALAVAGVCVIASGCGGGSSEAGVGTGGSGYAVGTITGFGSVIVDGVAWDDTRARVQVEGGPPAGTAPTLKIGQRVKIEYETAPAAKVIEIAPAAVGPVQAVELGAFPRLRVAGQTVQVNLKDATQPVTLLEGYSSAAEIAIGDVVEVHGAPILVGNTYVLQATRVEKLATAPPPTPGPAPTPTSPQRVQNVVQDYDAAARTLRLGNVTVSVATATVAPAGATISNGRTVTVVARPAPAGAPTDLIAESVSVLDLSTNTQPSELSGTVAGFDVTSRSFDLAGVRVNAAGASIEPGNQSIANGAVVVVRGSFRADGGFDATQVRIRKKGETPNYTYDVSLTGRIGAFVSLADFRVRGQRVDASNAQLLSCSNVQFRNGIEVEIGGAIVGDKVVAEQLVCR